MLVVFFIYGLAFFIFGAAILLKQDKRSTVRLRSLLLLLAGFGLVHGMSEWSDMFLTLGETYWTSFLFRTIKIVGFYLCLGSFVFLLAFGLRTVVPDKSKFKSLERASLIASLVWVVAVSVYGIRTGLSNEWYVMSSVLTRYLLALPGSLLVAAGLLRQSQSREIKEINSSSIVRNIRGMAVVFVVYALLAGVVVPKAPFPPATFINYSSFENVFVLPVQIFRAACSVLAVLFIGRILSAFSVVSYGELEKQVQERTSDLARVNEALLTDIAMRKRVEAEVEQARDAALEASRAKSEFLANMSHEIRTPLNGVMGMTDLVLETQLTREQREYLETVKLSSDSLLTVINDILDFSKIEAGKIDLEAIDFNLRDCLESTLKTLALRADEKGLELLCEVRPDVPEMIQGDSSRLRQIVTNLVDNAIKFTGKGEVAVKVQVQTESDHYRVLHFTVSDTGIGIAEDKRESIFAPFAQAESSTTRNYGGTGLGLTISARLVAMMGGKLWVESELGRGSQFHFTAQMKATDTEKIKADKAAPPEILRGVKVLIVDDNPSNRRILEGMLNRWEMKAVSVESGEEALAHLSAAQQSGEPYGLILTDMRMPKMDGFALVERIRRSRELPTAMIMMLTSAGHRGDALRCQELGVAAYLQKPIGRSELREAIARVLGAGERTGAIPLINRHSLQDARESRGALQVLLAEDNPVNQLLITRLLEKRGHSVVVAANGREALAALEKESYDLVFMDIQMPNMDGIEATAAIREKENGSGKHQPVIALTAHAMKGDQERCLDAGMDDYLSKPIRPQELDDILEKYRAGWKRRTCLKARQAECMNERSDDRNRDLFSLPSRTASVLAVLPMARTESSNEVK